MSELTDQAPDIVRYLDSLRESGKTNMFGAGPYLREEFALTKPESHAVLSAWMKADLKLPIAERAAQINPKGRNSDGYGS